MLKRFTCCILMLAALTAGRAYSQSSAIGVFDAQADVGPVKKRGDVKYYAADQKYEVSASGADVFFSKDELHFVYKKIKGDFILRTNAAFVGSDIHMYGKFGLMVRKSLDGNSAQVNAVVHGNKLTSLQYRKTAGDSTLEQRTDVPTAGILQLARRGNTYTMSVAKTGEAFGPEKKIDLDLGDEVYVGLFVCSHEADKIKKAVFSNVSIIIPAPIGIFDDHSDVGPVKHKGTVAYKPATQKYEVSGSGTNIWADKDEFHFVWKKMKGDFILRTNAEFLGKGTEAHRKWGFMVRKSLEGNSAHVNAVVHGDGLTSLQYRKTDGAVTEEQKSTVTFAGVVQLERRGNTYTMEAAKKGDVFGPAEKIDLDLGDEVYVGVFVCSHNADVTEKAVFSNVRVVSPAPADLVPYKKYLGSAIELLDMESQNSRIIYQSPKSLQAPNWTKDNKSLVYNSDGTLYKYNLATNTPAALNTSPAKNNNNDHVISFDGKQLVISSGDGGPSIGYTVSIDGGEAKQVTTKGVGASYMHGWSPDGKYLVFCGERGGEYDVYRIPANGGTEERFTTTKGLDDGPEYTPDGKYIYFNSVRSGLMQVWRMDADGKNQTQITNDDYNNWFPHISPDGKWIVYITFLKSEVAPGDHPFYKHVYIRVMPAAGGPSKVVAYLYGGQGTINTPSWSPDSKHIAFVSNSDLLFPVFPIAKN